MGYLGLILFPRRRTSVKRMTTENRPEDPETDERSSVGGHDHPLRWRRLLFPLGVVHVLVVTLSLISPFLTGEERGATPFSAYFDVNGEGNFPTWWSVAQLAAASTSLVFVAVLAQHQKIRGAAAWWILGGIVFLFSLDEGTELHERLDGLVLQFAEVPDFTFVWLILGVPLAAVVLIMAIISTRRLPEKSTRLIVLGIATLLFAAVGLEFVAGELIRLGAPVIALELLSHLEEFMELIAGSLLLVAPLAAVRTRTSGRATSFTLMDRDRR